MSDAPTEPRGRLVEDGYGPTLPELLRERRVPVVPALAAGGLLLALVVVAILLLRDPLDGREQYVHEGQPVFNILYGGGLELADAEGDELVRITGRRDRTDVTVTVRSLTLPEYRGDADGILPIVMTNRAGELREAGVQITGDAKGRIAAAPGYQTEFSYGGPGERGYGLDVAIVPPTERQTRDALLVSLRQTRPRGGATPAGRALSQAARSSLRSLRFGTELSYPD